MTTIKKQLVAKAQAEPHYTFVILALRNEHAAKLRQVILFMHRFSHCVCVCMHACMRLPTTPAAHHQTSTNPYLINQNKTTNNESNKDILDVLRPTHQRHP